MVCGITDILQHLIGTDKGHLCFYSILEFNNWHVYRIGQYYYRNDLGGNI